MTLSTTIRKNVHDCINRVKDRDQTIRAFANFDSDIVLDQVTALEQTDVSGSLAGKTIGIKDVIDAKGWPTLCNSQICDDKPAAKDAKVVERLRSAGAVIFGKTVTTEFAFMEPGPTVNPHDITRTPGGSSSGSAAAVADHQCFAALTTQTGGSTIRPAAFCGIFGYKPPFGRIPNDGLRLLSPSLDTIGIHARSVADLASVASVAESRPRPIEGSEAHSFVLLVLPEIEDAERYVLENAERASEALEASGAKMRRLELSDLYVDVSAAHRVVMSSEMVKVFADDMNSHPDKLSDSICGFIEFGQRQGDHDIAEARQMLANCRADFLKRFDPGEIIIQPAATCEAPIGLESTGSASFNRVWTALHTASLTIPFGVGPSGMPLGLQIIDPDLCGDFIFPAAQWAADALGSEAVPVKGA